MKIINKKNIKLLTLLVVLLTFTFVYCTDGVNYFNVFVEATYINEENESDKFNLFRVLDKFSTQDTKEIPSNYLSQSAIKINGEVFVDGNLNVGDEIFFEIPEVGIYEAEIEKISSDINNIKSIRGYIIDSEYSYIIISINDKMLTANINLIEENKQYTITYEKRNNSYYLNNIDNSDANMCKEENSIIDTNLSENKEYFKRDTTSSQNLDEEVNVDVMFVYTKDAKQWADSNVGSIDLAISNALEYGQLVLDNSNVGINLRMVHTYEADYTSTDSTRTDLFNITDYRDDYMNEVHDLRDKHGADLVVLIGYNYTNAAGTGFIAGKTGNASLGFSVSDVRYLSGSVMIHEIGHNMGCAHSRNQKSNPAPAKGGAFEYSTGWRWLGDDGKGYVSVMTYGEGDRRVSVFSNPNISWEGEPTGSYTGVYSPADNARSLREMKHVIANYRLEASIGNEVVTIEDENLLSTIRGVLKKPTGDITRVEMAKITSLYVNNNNIKSIKGLEYAINLTILNLNNNEVKDLTPLQKLEKLKYLDLSNNQIDDISQLSNLVELNKLYLSNNKISDITPLKDLSKLWILYLNNNQIEDIDYLNNLQILTTLYLSGNKINYIPDLKKLAQLKKLDLDVNLIEDISNLNSLINLEEIYINNNNISYIPQLNNLNNLNKFYCKNNIIEDISNINSLRNLKQLDLTNNKIEDIPQLNLLELNTLMLDYNQIKDISTLKNMPKINYLSLKDNKIKDISSLVEMLKNRVITDYITINLSNNFVDINEQRQYYNEIIAQTNVMLSISHRYVPVKVYLNEYKLNIEKDSIYELKTLIEPTNAYNKNMIWTSSDNNIVSVDENGLITGKNPGKALITVEMEDGGYYDTCEVTVTERNYVHTTEEDSSVNGKITINDLNGDELTYNKEMNPKNGVVTINMDGTWSYTPHKDFFGKDKFKVKIEADKGNVAIITVSITVSPINDQPVVPDYNAIIEEDKSANGKIIGTDVDDDKLTYSKETEPENGVVKVEEDGTWVYTPNNNYNGEDVFKVKVEDDKGAFATSTITITISQINDQPVVPDYDVTIEEDKSVNGKVIGTDVDGDKLTYSKETDSQNGVVKVEEDGTWVYTPNINYNGEDVFKVKVEDGNGGFVISTITITISPINDLPIVPNYDETIEEDKLANGKVLGTDVDGDKLTYNKETDPQNGVVKVEEDGTWVYTPNNNYNGEDVFKVKVEDENGGFVISTITITILPINDTPVFPDYDLNDDDIIDNKDILILSKYYGKKGKDQTYDSYLDYNSDNIIDLLDLVILSKQIN